MRIIIKAFIISAVLLNIPAAALQNLQPPDGMEHYIVGLLFRGDTFKNDPAVDQDELLEAHVRHLNRMEEKGFLVGAGPITDDGNLRGILIFRMDSVEQARQLAAADPALQAGALKMELFPWWGPAGIGEDYFSAKTENPDNVEMETYYFGLITRGDKWRPERTAETDRIQREHLANIRRLAEAGKLTAAGPFLHDGEYRGIFIFKSANLQQADSLSKTDPAVKAGRLKVELHPWWVAKGVLP
ncbi:MAG: YciI family protein [Calditrichia bacterium]